MSLGEFFEMGGYGKYVWSCYGICLIALALNIILPKIKQQKTLQALQKKLHSATDKN